MLRSATWLLQYCNAISYMHVLDFPSLVHEPECKHVASAFARGHQWKQVFLAVDQIDDCKSRLRTFSSNSGKLHTVSRCVAIEIL